MLDQGRQPGDVVGLDVGLDDGHDLRPLSLGAGDVLIDEIRMGIDDRELPLALAAEEVGGAGGLVVEELSEVHRGLQKVVWVEVDKVSIDCLNSNVASREAKDALFEAIASMGKAFASPRRLELIDLLAQGPRTVEELARATEQSAANTSQHLQALHGAGVVGRHREGTRVRYALAGDDVIELWSALQAISAGRIAEVERAARDYLGEPVEAVSRDGLIARLRRGDLVLVDVRPEEEFDAGHIDGAVSIPIDELAERLGELPEGADVVAYCRGPFCAYAHEAVRRLRDAGRSARLLEGGWPEWKLAQGKSTTARSAA